MKRRHGINTAIKKKNDDLYEREGQHCPSADSPAIITTMSDTVIAYSCAECNESFKKSSSFSKHVKRRHGISLFYKNKCNELQHQEEKESFPIKESSTSETTATIKVRAHK